MAPPRPLTSAPSPATIEAFGLHGEATPLSGGEGTSWRVGDVVLKPVDNVLQTWLGEAVSRIPQDGYRLPTVVPTHDGEWTHDGWGATGFVCGRSSEDATVDWIEVIAAARAFHTATTTLSRPTWLSLRDDPWSRADAVAWGERRPDVTGPLSPLVVTLSRVPAPDGPDQLIHGDLTGNVLVARNEPPAIIDVSPYWRPAEYAEGIVVADALTWHDASESLLERAGVSTSAVARGLLFRVLTTHEFQMVRPDAEMLRDEVARYHRALREIGLL